MAIPQPQHEQEKPGEPSRPPVAPQVMVDPRLLQANERTFLAWIRTSVGLMAFGFVIARLGLWLRLLHGPQADAGSSPSVIIGASVVAFAALLTGAAAARFVDVRRRLRSGASADIGPGLELVLSSAVGGLGIALAIYLLSR